MNDFKIAAGDTVYLSVSGYNGFFYPGEKQVRVLFDASGTKLAWVGSNSKQAIAVPESSVKISGSPEKKIPVWVDYK